MGKEIQTPDISIVASAVRVNRWSDFVASLKGNKCAYEVIFIGNVPPLEQMPGNFHWVKSFSCPAECYSIGFKMAKGRLIHWTADDCIYSKCCLDEIWTRWLDEKKEKIILEPLLFENYGKGWHENSGTQKFNSQWFSPLMAPFGFMSREWFNKLGGIDRNFTHGQYENDLVLRAMEDGGKVKIVHEAEVWVDHFGVHGGVEGSDFSKGYIEGRKFLGSCWIKDGKISKKRLKPLEPFI